MILSSKGIGLTAAAMISLMVGGCARTAPSYSSPGQSSSTRGASALAAGGGRGGELQALTARAIVDRLAKLGMAAPNPQDTTAQECPSAGCDQSIVTDTLRVKSFPTTGTAEVYAREHDYDQVATIVVSFAPPVPPMQQGWYWSAIQRLLASE